LKTRDGGYLPVEINARPPGGPILDMMNYSIEADLYRAYSEMIAGKRAGENYGIPAGRLHYCGFAGRKERSYRYTHDDIMERFGHRMMDHAEKPFSFLERDGKIQVSVYC